MSNHPIVHIELSANDREAAAAFYAKIFGWKIEQMPAMNYATFEASGGPGGGFNPVGKDNPAGSVIVYIATDDIPATLKQVEASGGKTLVPKTEIPGMGWFGVFADPTGNKVGLYTNGQM
jgi:predicted enzyme related to lactoylglutathione lyase